MGRKVCSWGVFAPAVIAVGRGKAWAFANKHLDRLGRSLNQRLRRLVSRLLCSLISVRSLVAACWLIGVSVVSAHAADPQSANRVTPVAASETRAATFPAVSESFVASNGQLEWFEDLETGWREAKRSGRPMLIFITSGSCQFCDAMKQRTLDDSAVRRRLAKGFVPIRLRPDRNAAVLSRITVKAFPTTLLAMPAGKVIGHRVGYQPPAQLHALLSEAEVAKIPVSTATATIR